MPQKLFYIRTLLCAFAVALTLLALLAACGGDSATEGPGSGEATDTPDAATSTPRPTQQQPGQPGRTPSATADAEPSPTPRGILGRIGGSPGEATPEPDATSEPGATPEPTSVFPFTRQPESQEDRETLIAFYHATDGENWDYGDTSRWPDDASQWLSDAPIGEWSGVNINDAGRVTGLYLRGLGLTGEIPPELADLPHLEYLYLGRNQLSGEIPPELDALTNLQWLDLSNNRLSGEIPPELGRLPNLFSLNLRNNHLTGEIPPNWDNIPAMYEFQVIRGNDLSGCITDALRDKIEERWNYSSPEKAGLPVCDTPDHAGDRAALTAFYNQAVDSENRYGGENWLTDAPLGEWAGVSTDAEGRVVRLHDRYGGLSLSSGELPPELGDLTSLKMLTFNGVGSGGIPPELGNLTNLRELRLYGEFTGAIPPELGNLANLRHLNLYGKLTGEIPPELGGLANLESLHLGDQLTGVIPPELGGLTSLNLLSIAGDLTGEIPPELGNLVKLDNLVLNDNQLTGEIPPELGDIAELRNLNLSGNLLTGEIPAELGNREYWELNLSNNQLTGEIPEELGNWVPNRSVRFSGFYNIPTVDLRNNDLSGRIPQGLEGILVYVQGNLRIDAPSNRTDKAALTALYDATEGDEWKQNDNWLSNEPLAQWEGVSVGSDGRVTGLSLGQENYDGNNLSGEIPPEIGDLSELRLLLLGYSRYGGSRGLEWGLEGEIPPELGNLRNLELLLLSGNKLSGEIPPELGNLSHLERLGLSTTELSGEIPPALSNLENLEELYLDSNRLNGEIPPELGNMDSLTHLELGDNRLSGVIPPELGNLYRLNELNLGNNQLTGEIPPELGNLRGLWGLDLSLNPLIGEVPAQLDNLYNLSQLRIGNQDQAIQGQESDIAEQLELMGLLDDPSLLEDPDFREQLVERLTVMGFPEDMIAALEQQGSGLTGCIPWGLQGQLDRYELGGLSFCKPQP